MTSSARPSRSARGRRASGGTSTSSEQQPGSECERCRRIHQAGGERAVDDLLLRITALRPVESLPGNQAARLRIMTVEDGGQNVGEDHQAVLLRRATDEHLTRKSRIHRDLQPGRA